MNEIYENHSEKDIMDIKIYKHEYRIISSLSDMMRDMREKNNISVEEISRDLNISKELLNEIENNDYFDLELTMKIFDYLGYELQPTFSVI